MLLSWILKILFFKWFRDDAKNYDDDHDTANEFVSVMQSLNDSGLGPLSFWVDVARYYCGRVLDLHYNAQRLNKAAN